MNALRNQLKILEWRARACEIYHKQKPFNMLLCRFYLHPGVQFLTCLQRLELIAENTLEPLPKELSLLSNLKSLHVEMEVAGG